MNSSVDVDWNGSHDACRSGIEGPILLAGRLCFEPRGVRGPARLTFTARDQQLRPVHTTVFTFTGVEGRPRLDFRAFKGADSYAAMTCAGSGCPAVTVARAGGVKWLEPK